MKPVAAAIGALGLTLVLSASASACFPEFRVGNGTDAAADSGIVADSGAVADSAIVADSDASSDAAGSLQRAGSTSGNLEYPAPTTLTIPYSVRHAGDLLVVGTYIASSSVSVTSLTDSLGNTFHSAVAQLGGTATDCSGQSVGAQLWYTASAAAGADSIVIVHDGGDAMGVFVVEYAGLGSNVHLDGTSSLAGTVPMPSMSAGTLTTTGPRDLVVALFADFGGYGAMAPASGFTAAGSDTGFDALIKDDTSAGTAGGAHEAKATLPSSADGGQACWVGLSAAFE